MFAAKADDDETIRQMCQQAEANTEIKDTSYGMTAFLLACENGCADAVRALADAGCNQQAKDADGSDGRKLAENEDPPHEDVLAVLVRFLSPPSVLSVQRRGSDRGGCLRRTSWLKSSRRRGLVAASAGAAPPQPRSRTSAPRVPRRASRPQTRAQRTHGVSRPAAPRSPMPCLRDQV